MDKLKSVFHVCNNNYLKWRSTPRVTLVFLLLAVFLFYSTAGTRALTATQNMGITPWLFPFILSFPLNIIIFYLALILLFCDAPFFDEQFPYLCMRSGRKVWVMGQILYLITASLIYVVAAYLLSILFCLPNLGFSQDWGKILRMMTMPMSNQFTKDYLTGIMQNPAQCANVMAQYAPLQATLLSMLLMWLNGVFLGLLMFTVNLRARQGVGALAAAFFVCLDFFALLFSDAHGFEANLIYYFSPVSWVNLANLQMGANYRPPLGYALTVLCLLIVFLAALSAYFMKKQEIEVLPEI